MDVITRLETALKSSNPRGQLQRLMSELLEKGYERDEIFTVLGSFQDQLTSQNRLDDAELVLEILDGFTGWCSI